jgi:hypothetical protein
MGDNAVTSVPKYQAADVLTAANLNITNSGIPVFSGTATRNDAFGGSGEKVLAEGQFAFLEDSNSTQFYDGSSWQSVGVAPGLVLVSATTVGSAVDTVTVSGAFSSTYDNYRITYTGGACSDASPNIFMQLGAANTAYYSIRSGYRYTAAALDFVDANNGAQWHVTGGQNNKVAVNIDVLAPNLAVNTFFNGTSNATSGIAITAGYQNSATQFTAFTIYPEAGTITGGIIRVYGYANS